MKAIRSMRMCPQNSPSNLCITAQRRYESTERPNDLPKRCAIAYGAMSKQCEDLCDTAGVRLSRANLDPGKNLTSEKTLRSLRFFIAQSYFISSRLTITRASGFLQIERSWHSRPKSKDRSKDHFLSTVERPSASSFSKRFLTLGSRRLWRKMDRAKNT